MDINNTVNKILNGELSKDSVNGNYWSALVESLLKQGFKYYNSRSKCSVASYEAHVEKDGKRFGVIVSNFLGVFTEITVSTN